MLTMHNWRLDIPDCGRTIGYEGENLSRRVEIQTDAPSNYTYYLDIEYSDGTKSALPLTHSDGLLSADLTKTYLDIPGPAAVTVRAVDGNAVRKSNMGILYVADAAGEGAPFQPAPGPGGETSGTTDHRQLSHRDAEGQHPIEAISGLEEEIKRIPAPIEALTNLELEELLK